MRELNIVLYSVLLILFIISVYVFVSSRPNKTVKHRVPNVIDERSVELNLDRDYIFGILKDNELQYSDFKQYIFLPYFVLHKPDCFSILIYKTDLKTYKNELNCIYNIKYITEKSRYTVDKQENIKSDIDSKEQQPANASLLESYGLDYDYTDGTLKSMNGFTLHNISRSRNSYTITFVFQHDNREKTLNVNIPQFYYNVFYEENDEEKENAPNRNSKELKCNHPVIMKKMNKKEGKNKNSSVYIPVVRDMTKVKKLLEIEKNINTKTSNLVQFYFENKNVSNKSYYKCDRGDEKPKRITCKNDGWYQGRGRCKDVNNDYNICYDAYPNYVWHDDSRAKSYKKCLSKWPFVEEIKCKSNEVFNGTNCVVEFPNNDPETICKHYPDGHKFKIENVHHPSYGKGYFQCTDKKTYRTVVCNRFKNDRVSPWTGVDCIHVECKDGDSAIHYKYFDRVNDYPNLNSNIPVHKYVCKYGLIADNSVSQTPKVRTFSNLANVKTVNDLIAFYKIDSETNAPTEISDVINAHKWYVVFEFPEYFYDERTGQKIIVTHYKQIDPKYFKYPKLRLHNPAFDMLLNFVKFSLYVDLDKNAYTKDDDNLRVDYDTANPPLILLQRELNEIKTITKDFTNDYRTSSWQNKNLVYKFIPSTKDFTPGHFTPDKGFMESRKTRPIKGKEAVAVYSSDKNYIVNSAKRFTNAEWDKNKIQYEDEYVYKNNGNTILGYDFEIVKKSSKKITKLYDKSNADEPCIGFNMEYVPNVVSYGKGYWCVNGRTVTTQEVPCYRFYTYLPKHDFNTCVGLPIPTWTRFNNLSKLYEVKPNKDKTKYDVISINGIGENAAIKLWR